MLNNTSEAYFARHMKRITELELWEIMDTGMENVNNTRVIETIISRDNTEYSSHTLSEVLDEKKRNEWILITRYRTSK